MDTTRTSSSAPAAALAALPARWSASLPGLHRAPAAPVVAASRSTETVLLPRGRAITLAEGACVLRVEAGRIWLTRSGDPDDHFIAADEHFVHDGNGVLVIECDSAAAAALCIDRPVAAPSATS
ncbi:MAG: hypothetical protein RLY71_4340 [Pseudomonadota bacterium]|jgi:hypothetical protein